jgi:hypothetical protein
MEYTMTAQTAPILAIQLEDLASPSSIDMSRDRQSLNALFRLIEQAEPTLLLCRDALAATCGHTYELKAIQASLDHIGDLKSNQLRVPAHP